MRIGASASKIGSNLANCSGPVPKTEALTVARVLRDRLVRLVLILAFILAAGRMFEPSDASAAYTRECAIVVTRLRYLNAQQDAAIAAGNTEKAANLATEIANWEGWMAGAC